MDSFGRLEKRTDSIKNPFAKKEHFHLILRLSKKERFSAAGIFYRRRFEIPACL
jgi:hypothetical protein